MTDFLATYHHLFNVFLIGSGYALSQWIVMRAGVFSVATAGLASIGAYGAAILTTKYGWPYPMSLLAGTLLGTIAGLLLSWPLARLRGVFQAIATLAFVQVVVALALYSDNLTGGAMGLNAIPTLVGTAETLAALALVVYLMLAISATRLGRAFEAIRQNEAVASSLGVSVNFHQSLAFGLSGAIAGLFGGLEAFQSFALFPATFGFSAVIAALSYVVLGGRRSVAGPIVGAAILLALVLVVYLMTAISATRLGRAFEAIRQNEAVASSLGVSVNFHQALAFGLSGAIAGLFGSLEALQSFALFPNTFGFPLVIAALSYVVLGGRRSVAGPMVGAAILLVLPELSRPLADYRMALYGAILMLVIAFLPRGIVDTALLALRRRRLARSGTREAAE